MLLPYAIYMLIMSVIDFFLMLIDKRRARRRQYRIPERVLFGVALLGGCVGGYIGMQLLHHKTKHAKFAVGLPILIVVHIVIFIALMYAGMIEI